MSYDVTDDPTYNPFAENGRPTTSQGFYSSAFLPSVTSTTRRRPSPFEEDEKPEHRRERNRHPRTRSEIQIVPPNSAGLHPLKSALFATASDDALSDNTHVTRPNLSRIVSKGQTLVSQKQEVGESSSNEMDVPIEEKDVIVHHVTLKDSLAGVSLKYGITLANLRRANQLWTSDSIHRRSVLYIPIEAASRAQEYIQETKLTLTTTPDASEDVTFDDTPSFDGEKNDVGPKIPSINVVRMPAKQLTYFPPSSTKNLESRSSRHSLDSPTLSSGPRISPTSSNKYDPSTLNSKSLTSILTAFPIAASTRDEIITRLSFDSVSSSYSDTSRQSPIESGHELDEVGKPSRGRKTRINVSLSNEGDADDMSMPTPKARPQNGSLPPSPTILTRQSSLRALGSLSKPSHIRSIPSCSPPRFYVSQPHESFVRTSQLEPSPAMEIPIPIRRSSTLGSASGKKLQATYGTERYPSKDSAGGKDIGLHSLVQRMTLQDHQL